MAAKAKNGHPHYDRLLAKVHVIHDLGKALAVLGWDREVNMPQAADASRITQMATLRGLVHEMSTSDVAGDLIEAAAEETADLDDDGDEASLVRVLRRDYAEQRRLPPSFVARSAQISGQARTAWAEARETDDFGHFRPWLEQVVELAREMAELYGYDGERYDALLDKFERETTTAEVRRLFADLAAETVPLVAAIAERGSEIDDRMLHQPYDVEGQREFARYIAAAVGYDLDRGHIGTAVHPFATSFSRDDARITTRWYPDFLNPSLFGTLHEAGHAMYEQGTHPDLARTPLARGTSSGIHESQSRMIENIVGRSHGFWRAHFGKLQSVFPEQLGGTDVDAFHRAINKVQPSCIRVEADELTYNLHIVLRFELEQALLDGDLAVPDLPAAWNDKMHDLLGITPPTDREGVLQDIHWSSPMFGYFPTYALGNLCAAQLAEAARAADPAVGAGLDEGRPAALVAWLREHVHQHGRKFTPAQIVERATGRPLDHTAFVRYVTGKFGALYDL